MNKIVLVSDRIREFARHPFMRPGATDLDLGYVIAVFDARERVLLEERANANPGKTVTTPNMGFVPHELRDGSPR